MKTLLILAVFACSAFGMDREQVDRLLSQAADAQGKEYLQLRARLAEAGEAALPLLREVAQDGQRTWQQRLTARILYERILRGDENEALRFHNWASYPPYQERWQPVTGPSSNMHQYVVPKLQEAGLWYYYIELMWKNTGEFGLAWGERRYQKGDVRFSYEAWPRWCRQALEGEPEELYLWMAIADRIEKDDRFLESYDNRELFSALVQRGYAMSVPILLQRWDEYVLKEYPNPSPNPEDRRMTHRNFLAKVLSFAEPAHVELLERFITRREETLGDLRPKLEEVRRRQPVKVEEPPFRCEKKPPLEGMVKPPPGFFDRPKPSEPEAPAPEKDVVIEVN